jgi:hypothetical protein
MNGVPSEQSDYKCFPKIKYLLFTRFKEKPVNEGQIRLSHIFQLQKEHIWHNNRYLYFNNIYKLDKGNCSESVIELVSRRGAQEYKAKAS